MGGFLLVEPPETQVADTERESMLGTVLAPLCNSSTEHLPQTWKKMLLLQGINLGLGRVR